MTKPPSLSSQTPYRRTFVDRRGTCVSTLLICFAVPLAASAADSSTFYALSDLNVDTSAKPVLINARAANPRDFPATFYYFIEGHSCTSTLVGTKVLMTAAHCVSDGQQVTIVKGASQFSGKCSQPKTYAANPTADWALCALNGEPAGITHETINSNNGLVQKDLVLLLSGFGCVSSSGSGGNDGVYRLGTSGVAVLPAGDNNDIVTSGGAALCFGDSGGPAFVVDPAALANPGDSNALAKRLVISVNSRGNIRNTSYLASTSTPLAQTFFKDWTAATGLKICGVNPDAERCRSLP